MVDKTNYAVLSARVLSFVCSESRPGYQCPGAQMMVTVQHAGSLASYWQPNHLLPFHAAGPGIGSIVHCQWHTGQSLVSSSTSCASTAVPQAAVFHVPVVKSPVPPAPVPVASTIEPEQPIGYGSFGVVW